MRYVLDRGHPLQPLAQMWLCFEVLAFVSKYLTVVEAVGNMYGPPSDCKHNLCGEVFWVCANVSGLFVELSSWP